MEPPLGLEYMKDMYDWCCKATGESEKRGKLPKRWDETACWVRMMAAEMKKAFNAMGEQRARVMDYGELGFRFDARVTAT